MRWPVDRPHGWNAGLTDPGPGRGELQVMSVESRGQPDAGWLAANATNASIIGLLHHSPVFLLLE